MEGVVDRKHLALPRGAGRPTRLHFLTVIPSPYQRELFRALNAEESLEVFVDYFAGSASDRKWVPETLPANETVLAGMQFLRGGAAGRFNPSVLRRLRGVRADLVVVSDYSAPSAQIAMRALSAAGRAWVYWGETPGLTRRGPVGLWARRRMQAPLRQATAIAAIGSRAVAAYERLFPHVRVVDIPYFCDLEPFRRAAEARLPGERRRFRILFSGQLIPRKGVDVLMRAFLAAQRRLPGIELRILGEGPLRGELERMAAPVSNHVVFLGHREPGDLPAVFAEADVFVLPSRHDGWGVVINEALGAGLPIVASDAVGAAEDVVAHDVNGLITPAGDAGALEDALIQLAGDPGRRSAMAEAARVRAAAWGLDEAVRRWRNLCAEVPGTHEAVRSPAGNCTA